MTLLRAWIALVALSAATTLVALGDLGPPAAGALILLAAWAKVRLIFLYYLRLSDVPGWRGGILFSLALYVSGLFVLYIAA